MGKPDDRDIPDEDDYLRDDDTPHRMIAAVPVTPDEAEALIEAGVAE